MKRFILLLTAIAFVFALGACANNNNASSDGGTTADSSVASDDTALSTEPVTLKVWMDNDDWAAAVTDAFTAHYPNVTIEFQNVGNTASHSKMSLDGPAGIGADVFFLPHDQMARVVNDGLSEPIPDEYSTKYTSTLVSQLTFDGKVYGVPVSTENIALFYNKDLWGANPPATFEEIIDFAATYNNPAEGKWTLAWQADNGYNSIWALTAGGFQVFGPNHDDYKNPGWDSAGAAKGLEYYMRLKAIFDVNSADASWDNTVERFKRGEIPVTITGPWAIQDCINNGINFGVAKIPTFDGIQPEVFSGLIVGNVSSYSENKDWAYKFLDFLVSEEGAGIMYNVTGKMTTLEDISNIEGLKDDAYLAGVAQQSPYTFPMPTIPEIDQMWEPLDGLLKFVWDGELNIAESQAKAMDTYKTLLAAAGKSMD